MAKSRDEENKIPRISKTCRVVLDGPGVRLDVGEFTITEKEPGPRLEQFADEAFKAARGSLARLMIPAYRLIVMDGQIEEAYGLARWVKLTNKNEEENMRSKQPIRKKVA